MVYYSQIGLYLEYILTIYRYILVVYVVLIVEPQFAKHYKTLTLNLVPSQHTLYIHTYIII